MSRVAALLLVAALLHHQASAAVTVERSNKHAAGEPWTAAGSSAGSSGGRRQLVSRRSMLQAGGNSQKAATEGSVASAGGGEARCEPAPTKELLQRRARNNTVMFAVMNEFQFDFGMTWLAHVKEVGIDYYVIAASDVFTSKALAAAGEPCFDWIDEEIPGLGLEWGSEGWRRMTWSKVFILDVIVDYGFNLVISDVDVVWFRNPLPLFQLNPLADLIFSEDGCHSTNNVGDEGLQREASPHHNFNTGVYLLRHSDNTSAWAHAWRKHYDTKEGRCVGHDQECAYQFMRGPLHPKHPQEPRLTAAWDGQLWMGIMDPSVAMNAHTLFVQQLHKKQKVDPYVVHMTWTYNGIAGKRSRIRDMALWHDPPEYYGQGNFLTVDLQLPESPPSFTVWNENEDMISFHLDSIHSQLQQAYVGLALAIAANRTFILPKFVCYCEKIWYSVVRCRVVDAQTMPLPIPCPQDYLFHPGHYTDFPDAHGTPLQLRESSFLVNKRTPAEVKESVLTIQPSAALDCSDCVKEEKGPGGPLLLVPPALKDAQLLPLLEPYRRYRVWRLSFEGVGSTRRAYSGFADVEAAKKLDARVSHMTTLFCCRREEELAKYHMTKQNQTVQLSLTSQFNYSSGGGSSSGSSGGGGGSGASTA